MTNGEPIRVQVVVNAHDPHLLVRFWASALHYEVEDTTALIERVREAGLTGDDDTFEADGQLWWNDLVGASAPGGAGPRLLFQRAPEPKEGRNRLHLDLHVGPDRRTSEAARLVELGATVLYEVDEPGGSSSPWLTPRATSCASDDGRWAPRGRPMGPVGRARDTGWEVGVSRTFPVSAERAWS